MKPKRLLSKILLLLLILCIASASCLAELPDFDDMLPEETAVIEPEPEEEVKEEVLPLSGKKIGLDPGHQRKGNYEKEPVAPNSKEKKAKVSSGTDSVTTGTPEYVVNLDVSLMLKEKLEALGAEVYMTRETHDVDISNIERATMMNEIGVDLVLRIHCNGADNKKANGMGMYVRSTGENKELCWTLADCLIDCMTAITGAKSTGVHKTNNYTGNNWSIPPCVLVEMGFMSNPTEDAKLVSPEYQDLLAQGMVDAIMQYYEIILDENEITN